MVPMPCEQWVLVRGSGDLTIGFHSFCTRGGWLHPRVILYETRLGSRENSNAARTHSDIVGKEMR